MEEKKNNKPSNEVMGKEKEKPEIEFSDVTPKGDEEAIERYIENIPEIFVEKYEKYINTHKEDDELTRRYPDDFGRSVRVLPMEKDGKRYLRMVSTDEKKTQDFHQFLKEGKFRFEEEVIEGVERDKVIIALAKCMMESERKLESKREMESESK